LNSFNALLPRDAALCPFYAGFPSHLPRSAAVASVEKALAPALALSYADVAAQTSELDSAKLYAASVYALETLYFALLRTQGVNPSTHAVMAEIARVRKAIDAITGASKVLGGRAEKERQRRAKRVAAGAGADAPEVGNGDDDGDDADADADAPAGPQGKRAKGAAVGGEARVHVAKEAAGRLVRGALAGNKTKSAKKAK
jgi:hypothetical protein